MERLPATLELAVVAMLFAILVAIPWDPGATRQATRVGRARPGGGAVAGQALARVLGGLILIIVLSVQLNPRWWPAVSGWSSARHCRW